MEEAFWYAGILCGRENKIKQEWFYKRMFTQWTFTVPETLISEWVLLKNTLTGNVQGVKQSTKEGTSPKEKKSAYLYKSKVNNKKTHKIMKQHKNK